MSSNPILSNINAIMPNQTNPIGSAIESYDLSDDTFERLMQEKNGFPNGETSINHEDIINKLGIPAGLQIEGFDYNDMLNGVSSTEKVSSVNADSKISADLKENIPSFMKDAMNMIKPSSGSSAENLVTNTISQTASSIKSFWTHQAQNIYNTMKKETVDDIAELISKL